MRRPHTQHKRAHPRGPELRNYTYADLPRIGNYATVQMSPYLATQSTRKS